MKLYTLEQLETLRKIRLSGYDKNDMLDDDYTNEHSSFDYYTTTFIQWLEKMEKKMQVDYLLINFKE